MERAEDGAPALATSLAAYSTVAAAAAEEEDSRMPTRLEAAGTDMMKRRG